MHFPNGFIRVWTDKAQFLYDLVSEIKLGHPNNDESNTGALPPANVYSADESEAALIEMLSRFSSPPEGEDNTTLVYFLHLATLSVTDTFQIDIGVMRYDTLQKRFKIGQTFYNAPMTPEEINSSNFKMPLGFGVFCRQGVIGMPLLSRSVISQEHGVNILGMQRDMTGNYTYGSPYRPPMTDRRPFAYTDEAMHAGIRGMAEGVLDCTFQREPGWRPRGAMTDGRYIPREPLYQNNDVHAVMPRVTKHDLDEEIEIVNLNGAPLPRRRGRLVLIDATGEMVDKMLMDAKPALRTDQFTLLEAMIRFASKLSSSPFWVVRVDQEVLQGARNPVGLMQIMAYYRASKPFYDSDQIGGLIAQVTARTRG